MQRVAHFWPQDWAFTLPIQGCWKHILVIQHYTKVKSFIKCSWQCLFYKRYFLWALRYLWGWKTSCSNPWACRKTLVGKIMKTFSSILQIWLKPQTAAPGGHQWNTEMILAVTECDWAKLCEAQQHNTAWNDYSPKWHHCLVFTSCIYRLGLYSLHFLAGHFIIVSA